jgi:NitT/TauT family transport system substrate-binding protein
MFKSNLQLLILGMLMLSLSGCKQNQGERGTLKRVTLRQEWFPNANYAGALYAAERFDEDHGIELVIEPGSESVDPVALVASGKSTFGDAAADRVLAANARGADLVIVGVVNVHSPAVFIAKAESGIRSPADFRGRRVGILTGTATEYVYRTLINGAGLSDAQIQEVEVPFELQTFVAGEYDVRPAFIYDEPVSLDMQNIRHVIIEPKNYGVDFIGTVYFTRRDFAENNPEIVRSFIFSVADGWRAAIKYPDRAIRFLHQYDSQTDTIRELRSLRRAIPYIAGGDTLLYAKPEQWRRMTDALQSLGVVTAVDLDRSIDDSFVLEYARARPSDR